MVARRSLLFVGAFLSDDRMSTSDGSFPCEWATPAILPSCQSFHQACSRAQDPQCLFLSRHGRATNYKNTSLWFHMCPMPLLLRLCTASVELPSSHLLHQIYQPVRMHGTASQKAREILCETPWIHKASASRSMRSTRNWMPKNTKKHLGTRLWARFWYTRKITGFNVPFQARFLLPESGSETWDESQSVLLHAHCIHLSRIPINKLKQIDKETKLCRRKSRLLSWRCCQATVITSLGGSMVIVGKGTLEVGAALADIRASLNREMNLIWKCHVNRLKAPKDGIECPAVTEFSAACMHSCTLL